MFSDRELWSNRGVVVWLSRLSTTPISHDFGAETALGLKSSLRAADLVSHTEAEYWWALDSALPT